MSSAILKVSTDKMKSKSEEIQGYVNTIETNWNLLYERVTNTKLYWLGEAGDYHRNSLKDDKNDMDKLIKKLKEHPKDLLTMAGIYEEAEKKAKELANALPSDVIV